MKKKLLCLVLAVVSALSFTACAAQDLRIAFDEVLPWETVASYEKSTYKIQKFTRADVGGVLTDDKLIAEGEYTTEIIGYDENKNFEVTTSFTITYANIDEAKIFVDDKNYYDHRGLTDTITSIVRFNDGMVPTYAEKEFICPPRPEGSKQFTPYAYKADYSTSSMIVSRGEETRTMSIGSGTKYDNEQLMYLVRGMSSTKSGASGDFYLVNPYDSFLRNTYVRYTMRSTCAATATGVKLNQNLSNAKFLIADKEGELKTDDQGLYTVNCIESTIAKTGELPGPSIKMLIADPSMTFKQRSMFDTTTNDTVVKTSKLIIQMRYLEYDVPKAKEQFNTVYTLTDYNLDNRLA